jgi:hypothetical protein
MHVGLNERMHVGLNLICLVPREMSGLETYARELTSALLREQPDLRVTAFVNREASSDPLWRELVPTVTVPVYGRRGHQWPDRTAQTQQGARMKTRSSCRRTGR